MYVRMHQQCGNPRVSLGAPCGGTIPKVLRIYVSKSVVSKPIVGGAKKEVFLRGGSPCIDLLSAAAAPLFQRFILPNWLPVGGVGVLSFFCCREKGERGCKV